MRTTKRTLGSSLTVKEIVEPSDGQAGGLEYRFERFWFEYPLAVDRNGHAVSKMVTYSPMQIDMATFLIKLYEPSPQKRSNNLPPGDPRQAGHYTATSSASNSFDVFSFFCTTCSRVTARRYSLMASLTFLMASSRVSPSLMQPGSAGQVAVYPSRLFPSKMIGSFIAQFLLEPSAHSDSQNDSELL